MEYKIEINEKTFEASLIEEDESKFTITIDEAEVELQAVFPQTNMMQLKADSGKSTFYTAKTSEGTWIWYKGKSRLVKDASKASRRSGSSSKDSGSGLVTPVTPGVVVKVLVETGEEVSKGQGLVVVSAMKMESTLVAGFDGTVSSVNTEEGQNVKPGDSLIDIEPAATSE